MQKEIEVVNINSVSCSGKEVPYDHPLVYLEIKDEMSAIACPYCGKEFIKKPKA